jgi:hypothetical protein
MRPSLCTRDELRVLIQDASAALQPALANGRTIEELLAAVELPKASAYRAEVDAILTDVPSEARLLIPMRSKRIKTTASTYTRRSVSN